MNRYNLGKGDKDCDADTEKEADVVEHPGSD
jgi:hypothetical protein